MLKAAVRIRSAASRSKAHRLPRRGCVVKNEQRRTDLLETTALTGAPRRSDTGHRCHAAATEIHLDGSKQHWLGNYRVAIPVLPHLEGVPVDAFAKSRTYVMCCIPDLYDDPPIAPW